MLPFGKAHVLRAPPDGTGSSPTRSTLLLLSVGILLVAQLGWPYLSSDAPPSLTVQRAFATSLAKCHELHELPGPPADFYERTESDRFDAGTPDVLITNATIWTGDEDGKEILVGDVFLRNGIIAHVAGKGEPVPAQLSSTTITIDARGAFLSPGTFPSAE